MSDKEKRNQGSKSPKGKENNLRRGFGETNQDNKRIEKGFEFQPPPKKPKKK